MAEPTLLLVDEAPSVARAFARRAVTAGWNVIHCPSVEDAQKRVASRGFDAWVVSVRVRGSEGMRLVRDHELVLATGVRSRRPRTALWIESSVDMPGDAATHAVVGFRRDEVDAMLAWLAEGRGHPVAMAAVVQSEAV